MSTNSHFSRFKRTLREFCLARKGNVALTFGLATIPIVCAVGAAIDYTHAVSVKAALQSALDSTALMMQKESATDTPDQLESNASKYFTAMFTRPEAQNVVVTAAYSEDNGSHVVITASADVPTNFMGIMGYNTIHIESSGTAKWGSALLRVALVLDNTGSMADDGKIDALKTATSNLLDQLKAAATDPGDVYVSIIPFSREVNVGTYQSAWDTWLYWDDAAHTDNSSWDATHGTCNKGSASKRSSCLNQPSCSLGASYADQGSCTTAGFCSISSRTTQATCETVPRCTNPGQLTQSNCTSQKACDNPAYTSRNSCKNNGGTWDFGQWAVWTQGVWLPAVWTPKDHSTWTSGCITDRGGYSNPGTSASYDQKIDAPTSPVSADSGYTPDQSSSGCPPASVMGLNTNWDTMKTLVSNMSPNGNTNQPIGLVWGWLSLAQPDGGGPFTVPAMDAGKQYAQIIILLSDGLNTQNRWTTSESGIDSRMYNTTDGTGTCKNIKDTGVTIYTIQVDTGGDPTSTLLQNCASSQDKFFKLTSADEIVTTFQQIGTDITKLHLSQ
ncbi:MAG TPA: TadE/TadG family type IV pilus assembly protein [Pseudolabrys sp.]|nr:TadE/TadG family type IV pilus assembly protein [Pseudolabrys sp.]